MSKASLNKIRDFALEKNNIGLSKFIASIDEAFELLELIFDSQGCLVDCVFLVVNPAFERLTGLRAANIIGKCKKENAPASDPKWYDFAIKAVRTGKTLHYDYYNDKVNRYFETKFVPISSTQIAVMFEDITKRKQAETALIASEERLKTYLECIPTAVFVANTFGNYIFANQGACKLLGYSKKEILKMSIPDVLSKESFNAGVQEFQKVKQTGKSQSELVLKRKNGSLVNAIVTASNLADGKLIANCEDISERRELEKQLRIKERLATIGITAGMVGHDIRNPLQAMISDMYLLKDELASLPEECTKDGIVESLDNIEKNIGYINKIVSDLQDYARTSEPNYVEVNLYELVTGIFQPIAIPDKVDCSIDIASYLRLKTDPDLITRMLTNLIINALQAMPDGGKLILKGYLDKNSAYIIVEDTGGGIPEQIKSKLFTPMTTTKSKGQGLGLAVVKRLVDALKGTISFESQVGEGTKFVIELPLR